MRVPLISATALALTLQLGALAPAHAADGSLPLRAATAIGELVAQQGNAALAQIREEFERELRQRVQPYLPERGSEVADSPQATAAPSAAR